MKLVNKIIIAIMFIGTLYCVYPLILALNIYGSLIKMSIVLTALLPLLLKKIFHLDIPIILETSYLVFIFLGHFLGSIVDFYHQIYWYDTFTHFLSGILVAMLAIYIITKKGMNTDKNIYLWLLFIVSLSAFIAVDWEIFEFVSDDLFNADAQNVATTGVNDTMVDMIVALLGALLFGISFIYEKLNNIIGPINKYINSIK